MRLTLNAKTSLPARHRGVLMVALTTSAASALAGPQVGEVIGQTSSTSMTVQARVVSSTPVVAQVAVPRQVCYDEMRAVPPRSNPAGALMGAIAGGAVGNAIGKGAGNALATGIGLFGGAILGDQIANDGRQGSTQTVRRCEQQAAYENRVVAYSVVYEYAGQRYSTQIDREPGATLPLQVTLAPIGTTPAPATLSSPVTVIEAPLVQSPPPVVVTPGVVYRNMWEVGPRPRHPHWY